MFQQILEGLSNAGGQNAMAVPAGYEDPVAKMNALEKLGLGLGGIDAVNSYRKSGMDLQDRQIEMKRLEALKELGARMQRGEITREQAQIEYGNISGDYSGVFGVGARPPAALQEWQAFSSMTPEEKREYLQMKRSNQMFDRGDAQVVLDAQGNPIVTYEKQLAPGDRPQTKYDQTAATEQAKVDVEKQAASGKVSDQAELMLKTIDDILEDEAGLEASTGGFLGLQGRAASITGGMTAEQRRFQPKIDQLKGQTFLNAYERLKGGGVITEIEGQKAESALARLSQAQDPADFRKALQDLKEVVMVGLERSKAPTFETDNATRVNWDNVNTDNTGGTGGSGRRTIKFGDLN